MPHWFAASAIGAVAKKTAIIAIAKILVSFDMIYGDYLEGY